jgi:thiol:disulfide interchange protein
MSKKRRHATGQLQKQQDARPPRWPQLAILVGVVLLVVVVLFLKNRGTDTPAVADSVVQATATLREAAGQAHATVELARAEAEVAAAAMPGESPEVQLNRLLAAGQPALAFFHSTNCAKCIEMMGLVAEVHPEFADSVGLVDVDVYDKANTRLLQLAGIRAIPTQIFFGRTGQGQVVLGVMTAEELREQLRALAGAAGDCGDESISGTCAP